MTGSAKASLMMAPFPYPDIRLPRQRRLRRRGLRSFSTQAAARTLLAIVLPIQHNDRYGSLQKSVHCCKRAVMTSLGHTRTIFVSLPVADVAKSTAFYEAIGFKKNAKFSNEQSSALAWSDAIVLMVLDKALYATFTPKQIIDAHASSGALFALSFESRDAVDAITNAAIAAGGREAHEPEDLGFMYSRAFEDLDGHGFGPMWMDPSVAAAGPPEAGA